MYIKLNFITWVFIYKHFQEGNMLDILIETIHLLKIGIILT